MSSGIVKGFPLNHFGERPPTRPALARPRSPLVPSGICKDFLLFHLRVGVTADFCLLAVALRFGCADGFAILQPSALSSEKVRSFGFFRLSFVP